ncbi:cytochrome b/b6 domain-containing protein [Chamaesiphon sp. VAR_69_metabat_338]|uniref:cytochrome b n=1 Tax=Chamaesiphon sp. VAR_69_metabat_338 TaxID=2964704 RepID=UPI00286DDA40|nr:cytochrome b/b6 domain-containing protein [Chamaesiphon sp. VAR_69_metabat_338]
MSAAPTPRLNNIFKQLMSMHWWMAGLYSILFASGITIERLQDGVSFRKLLYDAHKSFGVLVLLLLGWRAFLLLRVWGRKYAKHLPKLTSNWYFKTGLHTLLYVMMVAVPLSGYWLSNAYHANNISLFGIPMPDIFPVDGEAASQAAAAHSRTSKVFAIFIVVHFVAQYKVVKANWRRLVAWIVKIRAKG